MRDEQIDGAFGSSAAVPVDVVARIREQIRRDTQPVIPMTGVGSYALAFGSIVAAAAILFALLFGFNGLHFLPSTTAMLILGTLAATGACSVLMAARSMRPGAGGLHSAILGTVVLVVYEALIFTLFHDYSTRVFIQQGLICLALGVLCGAVAGVPIWLLVRRGFVVQPVRTGATIGLASGLAGVIGLTLHCPVTTVPHSGVWHAVVILVCVGAGAVLGRLLRTR